MQNITVLDRWIPVVNGWSEGLGSKIRCVKIREMGSSVTPMEKLVNSRFTSTPPCPTPALASNIYNLSISNPSIQVLFSFNHVPLSLTSQLTTHERYISLPYMVFECRHNIRNQLVSTTIPSPSSFRKITTIKKQQHFGEILKYVFSYVFKTVSHIANTQHRHSQRWFSFVLTRTNL